MYLENMAAALLKLVQLLLQLLLQRHKMVLVLLLPCALQVVPPEWRAWLAKTRQEPPSDEEMAR
jgi:hypothetical protein